MAAEDDDGGLGSLFLDESYVLQTIAVGSYEIPLFSLKCFSTDYDLTGQILWPGAELLNNFILKNIGIFQGASVLELGSGVGLTGLLCARICSHVVMTDHNDTVLKNMKKNVELQFSSVNPSNIATISCEKLEWGNEEQLAQIIDKSPQGFDFVLGADICYQQDSLPLLFKTVKQILCRGARRFFLGYVSRIHSTDAAFFKEVARHGLALREVPGLTAGQQHGYVYDITVGN